MALVIKIHSQSHFISNYEIWKMYTFWQINQCSKGGAAFVPRLPWNLKAQ